MEPKKVEQKLRIHSKIETDDFCWGSKNGWGVSDLSTFGCFRFRLRVFFSNNGRRDDANFPFNEKYFTNFNHNSQFDFRTHWSISLFVILRRLSEELFQYEYFSQYWENFIVFVYLQEYVTYIRFNKWYNLYGWLWYQRQQNTGERMFVKRKPIYFDDRHSERGTYTRMEKNTSLKIGVYKNIYVSYAYNSERKPQLCWVINADLEIVIFYADDDTWQDEFPALYSRLSTKVVRLAWLEYCQTHARRLLVWYFSTVLCSAWNIAMCFGSCDKMRDPITSVTLGQLPRRGATFTLIIIESLPSVMLLRDYTSESEYVGMKKPNGRGVVVIWRLFSLGFYFGVIFGHEFVTALQTWRRPKGLNE